MRRRAPVDWLGNVTFAVGLTLVMIGITYGIEPYGRDTMGWTNPTVLAELCAGVGLLAAFLVIETKVPDPMFRLRLFKHPRLQRRHALELPVRSRPRGPHVHAHHLAAGDLAAPARLLVRRHAPLGRHLHAAAHGRLPARGAGLGDLVRPVRLAPVRDRGDGGGGGELSSFSSCSRWTSPTRTSPPSSF